MVEYGGLDAKAKDELKNYYTNAYLPDGSGSNVAMAAGNLKVVAPAD